MQEQVLGPTYPICQKLNLFYPSSDPPMVSPGRLKMSIGRHLFIQFCARHHRRGYPHLDDHGLRPIDVERFLFTHRTHTPIRQLLSGEFLPYPHMVQ